MRVRGGGGGRPLVVVALAALVACACAAPAPARPGPQPESPGTASGPSPAGAFPSPEPQRSLSLEEEVGAVMMVGFQGELTDAILAEWGRHQYGGLLVVNLNHNASSSAVMSRLIGRLRGANRRRLLAATDQEGSGVCIALADVPCAPHPANREESAAMAGALHSLGFDVDLGPVADVCSVPGSVMTGRCYGHSPGTVAAQVGEAVDGIHAAGMLSAAKHFPGHGGTRVSSEDQLPAIDASLATMRERDWPPFRTAVQHQTDMILLGHLNVTAIDTVPASLSPRTVTLLRQELGFRGAIISDDLEMGAVTAGTTTPQAAVAFLAAGGDMVMVGHHLEVADATFEAIRAAVLSGRLPRERLDQAVASLAALRAG